MIESCRAIVYSPNRSFIVWKQSGGFKGRWLEWARFGLSWRRIGLQIFARPIEARRFFIKKDYCLCGRWRESGVHRLSQDLMTTTMRQPAFIGRVIAPRNRLWRVSAILRFGMAIVIGAGIGACHHSDPPSTTSPSATSGSSTPTKNPVVGRWQAEISNSVGQRQRCVMDISGTGQIAYGDSCPLPLTNQQATIASQPNGTFAPNLYVAGKDSGTFVLTGGGVSGMTGAFRIESSNLLRTRTAPGADIEWTRISSETPMQSAAGSQVLPQQIQWPANDVPAIAQRATAYVRTKWQPDAFLTSIQMELAGGVGNAQSPAGGLLVQLTFYSPGRQQTLTYLPNSPGSELTPGSGANPADQRAMPASFIDLPVAVAKLRAKGLRRKVIQTAHIENYSPGSDAGDIEVDGTQWIIDSGLDQYGAVFAELPDQNLATVSRSEDDLVDNPTTKSNVPKVKGRPHAVDTSGYLNGRPFFSSNPNDQPK